MKKIENKTVHRAFKLNKLISLYIFGTMILFGMILISVNIWTGHQLTEHSLKEFQHRYVDSLESAVDTFFTNHLQILNDYSQFPIMTQTVMQPELNRENIADTFKTLSFLGANYPMALYDFQGNLIYQNPGAPLKGTSKMLWMEKLLEGELPYYIGSYANDDAKGWVFGVSIVYNGYNEGILVLEVPADSMRESVFPTLEDNTMFQLLDSENVILEIGKIGSETWTDYRLKKYGLDIRYYQSQNTLQEHFTQVLAFSMVSMIGVTVGVILFTLHSSRKWLGKPIGELRQRTQLLIEDKQESGVNHRFGIFEIDALSQDFNRMAARVKRRETSLKQAQERLIEQNIRLEKEIEERRQAQNELEQTQAQLLQSEKMASVGQLAAGVAHEINNPLGFARSNLKTLNDYFDELFPLLTHLTQQTEAPDRNQWNGELDKLLDEADLTYILEDLPEIFGDSHEGIERVKDIVCDLKTFSHIDQAESMPFDVNQGLTTTLNVACNEIKYKAKVIKNFGDVPPLDAYPQQLNQVFLNMIINASHAIENNGEIRITTHADRQNIYIKFEDNGKGIEPEIASRIFEPFFTTKEIGKGTGLGLSVSYGIIQKHHGKIDVESTPGVGTKFTIQLPLEGITHETEHQESLVHG